MKKQKIIAIVGPTATGKSTLAVVLARQFQGEIISADSRQIYTGLSIGTGKITKKEMLGIPHHLLDISNPKKIVSVHEYALKARKALGSIIKNNRVPIVCGGTGFYIDTFLFEKTYPEVPPNTSLRAKLETFSTAELIKKLTTLDSRRAKEIDPHNRVRIIRALEIINAIGKVPKIKTSSPHDVLCIGLKTDEKFLKAQIKKRLDARIKKGMIAEAINLHAKGLSYKRMNELGLEYKYLSLYLQRRITKQEMTGQLETAIWQYSRKQMTWFRKNPDIVWLDPKQKSTVTKASKLVKEFLTS